ncbi:MAG TPA: hypothetical protein VMP68_32975 [Candidatus Eisenbacteria bacterium]|nr:hypothetical protein [Candidatus Eisenbacteria bacterium]
MKYRSRVALNLLALPSLACAVLMIATVYLLVARQMFALSPPRGFAPQQARWKSRQEYDDFQKILTSGCPARIPAADAFLQTHPESGFRDQADLAKMQCYQQSGDFGRAIDAARDALRENPRNLGALNYLSFALPFVYKPTDVNSNEQLTALQEYAQSGLVALSQQARPANMTSDQFDQRVKQLRANFNDAKGFVALQRKDYATALAFLDAAKQDNSTDPYLFFRLGLAFLNSSPPDFDHAIWNLARASALARTAKSPSAAGIEKYYQEEYRLIQSSNADGDQIEAEAALTVEPPAGFTVRATSVAPAPGFARTEARSAPSTSLVSTDTITLDNRSGKDALVKLVGPSGQALAVPNGQFKIATVAPGQYSILVRYGDGPTEYSYLQGDPFGVTESASEHSAIKITLHQVSGGNYTAHPATSALFDAVSPAGSAEPPARSPSSTSGTTSKGPAEDTDTAVCPSTSDITASITAKGFSQSATGSYGIRPTRG